MNDFVMSDFQAYELCEKGHNVIMLEKYAGQKVSP